MGGCAERQRCAVQAPGEHQGIARARNHTCSELSSVLSTRTRAAAPLSVVETTSVGSSRSWSGAIVTPPRARGVLRRSDKPVSTEAGHPLEKFG
eukprot:scaffold7714_cov133-Isochrysis_galbana.AAC.5